MQAINIESFEKRIEYLLAKTYANQLKSGEEYSYKNPVIALTITDFKMFKELKDVITYWGFKEKTKLIDYPKEDLQMIFV